MALTSGTRLGPYEILAPIGAGGMGEVYRARDTKLGRDVAIKVLPEEFARDKERLERFEREAKLLAQLNHANIATLYGLEEHDRQQFIVMELVEGEDLATRLRRGPIPVGEAVALFTQVADGLEAAHEHGIIHRDLKPANLRITEEGRVKILDFGLAKPVEAPPGADVSETPTMGVGGTSAGVVLGTGPYMSPEQTVGKAVDKRADVWAFGCCLYETLTGKRAFKGETIQEIIVDINKEEPDWEALPDATPEQVRRILRRCLAKSPRDRLRDIGDARVDLEQPPGRDGRFSGERGLRRVVVAVAFAAFVAVAVWGLLRVSGTGASNGTPVVILMDTLAPEGVYDSETRRNSGTNADDLNHELRELPVVLHKETVGSTWDREDQILKQQPDLVLIHRSSFFHALNLELGFPFDDEMDEERLARFYAFVNNRLVAFLGYVGLASPRTSFLVYSRGWTDEARGDWISEVENRFPSLKGRVFAMKVPVGPNGASFRDPATAELARDHVRSILGVSLSP